MGHHHSHRHSRDRRLLFPRRDDLRSFAVCIFGGSLVRHGANILTDQLFDIHNFKVRVQIEE